ncbi:MAG TPA: VWA domain-containing protein [Acidobacteriaceae bacterium]|nr:VWA domain-containing protein [Acidobacteriaceae bacterium]
MRFLKALTLVYFLALGTLALAQAPAPPVQTGTVFHAGTTLVLVPALVRTKKGEPVFTLTADDFVLTDDDAPQKLSLEQDTDSEPLALVVAVEIGGAGARHLDDYRNLGSTIEALVGNVSHRVAIVGFDSEPRLLEGFTSDLSATAAGLHDLESGDSGAAILDGLKFSVDQLQKQPPQYRRAILLLSETVDHGSNIPLEDAVRAVSDTNTVIYSFAFSSTKSTAGHEASQFSDDQHPGPPGGCFANDPNADPSEKKGKAEKTYDCLSLLAPPLRLAKIAALIAMNSMRQNASETVAHLTGGEYYTFKDHRSLQKDMLTVSNHVPNRYVLSFRPEAPHPGIHTLKLRLKDYPKLEITARRSYWAEDASTDAPSLSH